jgi:hypothetical protein
MLGNTGDNVFEKVWPANTTPVAADGAGTNALSLGGYVIQNTAAAARYVRFFDKSSAPTMGTDLAKIVIPVAAGAVVSVDYNRPPGFTKGLWISVTTGQADNDNTAPVAGDVLLDVFYQ